MLRGAITLLALGLVAMLLGRYDVAGISYGLGRALLFAFVALAMVGFVAALVTGDRETGPAAQT